MKKIVKYLRGVRSELKKVSWPSRKQVFKLTMVVVIITGAVSVYLGGLDFIFAKIVGILLR